MLQDNLKLCHCGSPDARLEQITYFATPAATNGIGVTSDGVYFFQPSILEYSLRIVELLSCRYRHKTLAIHAKIE